MKTIWLVLGSLFAFAAVGTGQEASRRNVRSVVDRWFCRRPGCFTAIHQVPAQEDLGIKGPTLPPLELSLQEASRRNVRSVEESISPGAEPSLQEQRETGSAHRWWFCPGCFTPLHQHPPLEDLVIKLPTLPPLEQSQQEASRRNVRSVEESISPGAEPSLQDQRETGSALRWWFCRRTGCLSALHELPPQEALGIKGPTLSPLELSQQEPRSEARTKRSARRARGKQRSGARAVCRGCYSGLMIVAPPAQGSGNETWIGSHSESEGDSSEEDTLPPKA